jgi:predicted nucleic-acid-binding Zn-ribbon protein
MQFYNIKVDQMYEFIGISFSKLLALSKLFGTEKIDVNDYSQSGCETCDYGSSYQHTIQVYDPTSNIDMLEQMSTNKNLVNYD